MMNLSIKDTTKTAMMTAIIFVCTYAFKIPIALTGGYTHLGDCAIFLGIMILGRKRGMIAAAFGAALADFTGGFMIWVIPTFLIKGIMAGLMGTLTEGRLSSHRFGWLAGAALGGIFQILAYTLVKFVMISPAAALATIPTVSIQTTAGILISAVFISLLQSSHALCRLKEL